MLLSIEQIYHALVHSTLSAYAALPSIPAKDARAALDRISMLESEAVRLAYLYGAT